MTETIEVCPECDSPSIKNRVNRGTGLPSDHRERYYCPGCGARFDGPDVRERRRHGMPNRGLAAELARMGERSQSA